MVIANCPLFKRDMPIRCSHIFPKFIFKSLKWSNQSKFILCEGDKRPMQDGIKGLLLSHEAEQVFSKYEKWFAQNIYKPYQEHKLMHNVNYDFHLYYFLVLQIWRTCLYFIKTEEDCEDNIYDFLNVAMEEWREFLLNKTIPINYKKFFLMPLSSASAIFPRCLESELYLQRIIEFNIMTSEDRDVVVYCKLPSFIIWTPLEMHEKKEYGFNISPTGGNIDISNYFLTNENAIDYIWYKIVQYSKWRENNALLRPEYIKKIQKRMMADSEFKKSKLASILSMETLSDVLEKLPVKNHENVI